MTQRLKQMTPWLCNYATREKVFFYQAFHAEQDMAARAHG